MRRQISGKSEILDGVRTNCRLEERQPGTPLAYHRVKDVHRVLFTLIMPKHTNLYLAVVAKVLMVMHFARKERIRLHIQRLLQQKIACTTANGHALHRTRQQFVVHQALHAKSLLHPLQENQRVLAVRQITYHTRTGLNRTRICPRTHRHMPGLQQHNIHQAQTFCHHVVDSVYGRIKVCMGRINGNVIPQSHANTSLHSIFVRQMLQPSEDKRMVRHNHIASQLQSLANHLFGHVKAQ